MLCAKQNLTEGEQIMSKFLSKIYIFRWIFPLITSGSMVFWKVRRGGSVSSSVRGIREVCERGAVKSRECDSDRRPTKCHRWRISRGLQIYPCLHDQQGSNDSHLNLIRHRDRLLVAPLTLRPAAHSHLWKSRFPPGERATGSYSKAGHPRFYVSEHQLHSSSPVSDGLLSLSLKFLPQVFPHVGALLSNTGETALW